MNDIVYIDRELTIFTLNTVLAGNLFGLKITTILKIIYHLVCNVINFLAKYTFSLHYRSKDGCNGSKSTRASKMSFFIMSSAVAWFASKYIISTG